MRVLGILAAAVLALTFSMPASASEYSIEMQFAGIASGRLGDRLFENAPVAFWIYVDPEQTTAPERGEPFTLMTAPGSATFYLGSDGGGFVDIASPAQVVLRHGRGDASSLQLVLLGGPTVLTLVGADFDGYGLGGDFATFSQLPASLVADHALATSAGMLTFAPDSATTIGFSASYGLESAIPEPGHWVLLAGGFGVIGLMARRRGSTAAA